MVSASEVMSRSIVPTLFQGRDRCRGSAPPAPRWSLPPERREEHRWQHDRGDVRRPAHLVARGSGADRRATRRQRRSKRHAITEAGGVHDDGRGDDRVRRVGVNNDRGDVHVDRAAKEHKRVTLSDIAGLDRQVRVRVLRYRRCRRSEHTYRHNKGVHQPEHQPKPPATVTSSVGYPTARIDLLRPRRPDRRLDGRTAAAGWTGTGRSMVDES